jgi:hypothetical protein
MTARLATLALLCPLLAGAAESGTITGRVRLVGRAPPIPQIKAEVDAEICGARARPAQALALGANQTVAGAIVYLNGARQTGSAAPVTLEMLDCEFVPRVQVAGSGAALTVRNRDPLLHVVRIVALNATNAPVPLLAVAAPYAGFEKKYQLANFREPTLLKAFSGNGLNWMAAYIAVMPHPWAALTDESGMFVIRGVPPGTHKLYAWHEALGTLTREVKVTTDRSATVELEFGSPASRRSD